MTGNRRISIAEYLDPMGRRDREIQESGLDIQAARVRLQGEIAAAQFRRDDARHADEMAMRQAEISQEERHHSDRMDIMHHANEIREMQISFAKDRNAAEIALGRDRLAFDEQRALLEAKVSRENALIHAQTSIAIAELQADKASELAQLNHAQAMTLAREESHLRTMEIAKRAPYDALASTFRKSEDTNRALTSGMTAIFVERQKATLAAYLEDQQERHREAAHRRQMETEGQKEKHRANERGHELTMAERSARFARVGFTLDELTAAGFTPDEAALILARLIGGINPQDDDEAAIFSKFDQWYAANRA